MRNLKPTVTVNVLVKTTLLVLAKKIGSESANLLQIITCENI